MGKVIDIAHKLPIIDNIEEESEKSKEEDSLDTLNDIMEFMSRFYNH